MGGHGNPQGGPKVGSRAVPTRGRGVPRSAPPRDVAVATSPLPWRPRRASLPPRAGRAGVYY